MNASTTRFFLTASRFHVNERMYWKDEKNDRDKLNEIATNVSFYAYFLFLFFRVLIRAFNSILSLIYFYFTGSVLNTCAVKRKEIATIVRSAATNTKWVDTCIFLDPLSISPRR